MTGPAEWEFSGTLRPGDRRLGARHARSVGRDGGVEIVTFGCRLNTYESEVMRREADSAGLAARRTAPSSSTPARSPARRCARRGRRSARRGATIPSARIIVTGCAAQTEPARLRRHGRGRPRHRQCREAEGRDLSRAAGFRRRRSTTRCTSTTSCRVRETAGAPGRRASTAAPAPSCRCRTAATTAAPSASSPMAAALRARCRWARWSSRSGGSSATAMREVVLTGVDITTYGADLPGAPTLGKLVADDPAPRAGPAAAAAFLDRLDRGRRRR